MSTRSKIKAMIQANNVQHMTNYDEAEINSIRIENCVGFTKIPIGIAGPLLVHGPGGGRREVYAPMATTEATLVASCSRGCKALTAGGGAHWVALSECMVRAPCFRFASPAGAVAFRQAWPAIESDFRRWAEATSRHARLQSAAVHLVGADAHVVCKFACGAAAGQNMVTKACDAACAQLLASAWAAPLAIRGHLMDGNMSSDKKPSFGNVLRHRGTEAQAWGTLPDAVCRRVLGCPAAALYDVHTTLLHGGLRDGHFGTNVNAANVLAALFIALGQDPASVAEAAWAHLRVDLDRDTHALTYSLYCPSLPVGTVGGGTAYAPQQEALRLFGCTGPDQKGELAGLIACFALALDISTAAAVANGTFSASHMQYARGDAQAVQAAKAKAGEAKL